MNAEFDVMVKKVNFSSPENMQKPFDSLVILTGERILIWI